MKALIITVLAVLGAALVYMKLTGKKPKFLTYFDPQTGKTVKVDASSVLVKDGKIQFEGPDVDPISGGYVTANAQPGTVEFSAQNN
jgi:phage baseplate assembly protein gpV